MTDSRQDDDNLGSFYMGRMRNPPEPRRILPKGMLSAVTLFAFVAIIWYAYPQGQEKFSRMDVPTIAADVSVYKFRPENPGGMEVPHQDSTVFDPIDNKAADSSKIEKLGAPPEEPVDKEFMLSGSGAPIDKKMERLNLDMQIKEMPGGTEKIVPVPEPEPAIVKTDEKPAALPKVEAKPEKVESPKPVKKPAAKTAAVKPGAAAPQPAPVVTEELKPAPRVELMKKTETPATVAAAKEEAAKPAPKKDGTYIQLGSYRDLKAAKEDWAKLQKKYPQSIGKMTIHLETKDLGAKGVYHRLQARAASEDRAKHICKVLKSSGDPDCIIVR